MQIDNNCSLPGRRCTARTARSSWATTSTSDGPIVGSQIILSEQRRRRTPFRNDRDRAGRACRRTPRSTRSRTRRRASRARRLKPAACAADRGVRGPCSRPVRLLACARARQLRERRRRARASAPFRRAARLCLHELRHGARVARQRPGASRGCCCAAAAARAASAISARLPARRARDRGPRRGAASSTFGLSRRGVRGVVLLRRARRPSRATDLTHRIVPNRIVVPAAAIVLRGADRARSRAPSGRSERSAPSGFLFVAALAYPAGMGMGDVKLALLLGAMLGRLVGGRPDARHARRARAEHRTCSPATGSAARKMGIPFAPFLALGALVALFVGAAAARRVSEHTSSAQLSRRVLPIPRSRDPDGPQAAQQAQAVRQVRSRRSPPPGGDAGLPARLRGQRGRRARRRPDRGDRPRLRRPPGAPSAAGSSREARSRRRCWTRASPRRRASRARSPAASSCRSSTCR